MSCPVQNIDIDRAVLENIDIDRAVLENINIDLAVLENIDISIDIDKEILENINIDIDKEISKISISIKYRIDWNLAYRTGLRPS